MILKRKIYSIIKPDSSYSRWKRFKAGMKDTIKPAILGAELGAVLAPGNLTALVLKKKKLAAGLTLAGAGIGAIIGARHGYLNEVENYDYKHETDPRKLEERFEENKKLLKDQLKRLSVLRNVSPSPQSWKKLEKDYNIKFSADLYKYDRLVCEFYRREIPKLIESLKTVKPEIINTTYLYNLSNVIIEMFILLDPQVAKQELDSLDQDNFEKSIIISIQQSNDHDWLFYNLNDDSYNFPLGFGYENKKIGETLKNHLMPTYNYLKKQNNPEIDSILLGMVERYFQKLRTL